MLDGDIEQRPQHAQQIALRRRLSGLLTDHCFDVMPLQQRDPLVAVLCAEGFKDIAVGLLGDRFVLSESVVLIENNDCGVHGAGRSAVGADLHFRRSAIA